MSVEVQRVLEVYDDRLRVVTQADDARLTGSLLDGDVSSAWAVWSSAAESALADAYCFAGGPVPDRGPVLGRGVAKFRVLLSDGPRVRKLRNNAVDLVDGRDVHMYRADSRMHLCRRWWTTCLTLFDFWTARLPSRSSTCPRSQKPLSSRVLVDRAQSMLQVVRVTSL